MTEVITIDLHQTFGSISDLAASGIREVPAVFKLPSQIQDCRSSCSSSSSSSSSNSSGDDENNGTAGIHEENSVAVIDLSDLLHQDSERRASVVANIRSALEEWGFFQVRECVCTHLSEWLF
jgi:RNase P/RNase MRP subunit p30